MNKKEALTAIDKYRRDVAMGNCRLSRNDLLTLVRDIVTSIEEI